MLMLLLVVWTSGSKHASDRVKLLVGAKQRVPPQVRDMASHVGGNGMGRGRRWNSGPSEYDTGNEGGRCDSPYKGRVGWGMTLNSDRGGGRDNDREQQNRHGFGSSVVQESNATGSLSHKSFHESTMAAAKNSHSSPSCGRRTSRKSVCSDNHDRARSRSRCIERFGDAAATAARFSYHESMLAHALSSISKDRVTSL